MGKVYSKNKKAYFDYEIIETLEAGISLSGAEVKSVRASNVQLKGSYVIIKDTGYGRRQACWHRYRARLRSKSNS